VEYTNGDLDLGVRFLDFRVQRGKPGEPRTVLVQRAHVVASMSTRAGLAAPLQEDPEPDPAAPAAPAAAEETPPAPPPAEPAAPAVDPVPRPASGGPASAPQSALVDTQPLGLAARLASAGELSMLGAAHQQSGLAHHPALGHALRGVSAPAAPQSASSLAVTAAPRGLASQSFSPTATPTAEQLAALDQLLAMHSPSTPRDWATLMQLQQHLGDVSAAVAFATAAQGAAAGPPPQQQHGIAAAGLGGLQQQGLPSGLGRPGSGETMPARPIPVRPVPRSMSAADPWRHANGLQRGHDEQSPSPAAADSLRSASAGGFHPAAAQARNGRPPLGGGAAGGAAGHPLASADLNRGSAGADLSVSPPAAANVRPSPFQHPLLTVEHQDAKAAAFGGRKAEPSAMTLQDPSPGAVSGAQLPPTSSGAEALQRPGSGGITINSGVPPLSSSPFRGSGRLNGFGGRYGSAGGANRGSFLAEQPALPITRPTVTSGSGDLDRLLNAMPGMHSVGSGGRVPVSTGSPVGSGLSSPPLLPRKGSATSGLDSAAPEQHARQPWQETKAAAPGAAENGIPASSATPNGLLAQSAEVTLPPCSLDQMPLNCPILDSQPCLHQCPSKCQMFRPAKTTICDTRPNNKRRLMRLNACRWLRPRWTLRPATEPQTLLWRRRVRHQSRHRRPPPWQATSCRPCSRRAAG